MFKNFTYHQFKELHKPLTTILRSKRHYDFVGNVEEIENCYRPPGYHENIQEACEFVKSTPSCNGVVSLFNYLQFYVCTLQLDASAVRGVPTIVMCGVILYVYFLGLYVSARYFLLSNSIVFSNYLNTNNYIFGNIVLGIMFTLPFHLTMIFDCVEYNRTDYLLHAQTFGKMFTCFAVGLCLLSYRGSFQLNGVIFLREMFCLTAASIYLYECVYRELMNENKPPLMRKKPLIHIHAYVSLFIYVAYVLSIFLCSTKRSDTSSVPKDLDDVTSSSSDNVDSDAYPELYFNTVETDVNSFKQLFDCINPWKALKDHAFPVRLVMSPFYVFNAIFTPVVNKDRRLNGWCKWIVCFSCMAFPLYVLVLQLNYYTIILITLVGISAALAVMALTHAQRVPTNHELISFWGLIIGFAIFNIIDLEICCILWQFLNYVKNMDNDVIMLVAFPFSYVFVEGIFVVTLMENGYRDMALGFVMGTVVFIAYSALPVMLFSVCFGGDHVYSVTDNTTTAFYFMLIVEVVTIFGFSLNGYELRPSGSVFFGLAAVLFSLYILLEDEGIIHAYGTMHSFTVFVDVLHNQWA